MKPATVKVRSEEWMPLAPHPWGEDMKIAHLVLKGKYYDAIKQGQKRNEYRENTPYWRKRLMGATHIVFHRGYTDITMMWTVQDADFPWDPEEDIIIRLGSQVSDP